MYTTKVTKLRTDYEITSAPVLNSERQRKSTETYTFGEFNESIAFEKDKCAEYSKCVGNNLYCRCDKTCKDYGDCCLGYMNMSNWTPEVESIFKCSSFASDAIDSLWGVYVISTCPPKYDDGHVINLCLNETLHEAGPPVVNMYNWTLIFRNKYCAICNDVTNFAYFNVAYLPKRLVKGSLVLRMLDMTATELQNFLYNQSWYQIQVPSDVNPRYCLKKLQTNGDPACQMYVNPVYYNNVNQFYRNSFCASTTNKQTCFGKVSGYFPKPDYRNLRSSKFSIVFSSASMDTQKCGEWNPKSWNINVCHNLPLFTNSPFDIQYSIEVPRNTTEKELIQVGLISILMKNVVSLTEVVGSVKMYVNNDSTVLKIESDGRILKAAFSHEVKGILQSLTNQTAVLTISGGNGKSVYRIGKLKQQSKEPTSHDSILFTTKPVGVIKVEIYLRAYDIQSKIPIFTDVCSEVEISAKRIGNETTVVDSFKCAGIKHTSGNSELSALSVINLLTLQLFNIRAIIN